jgi:hypothetical protein
MKSQSENDEVDNLLDVLTVLIYMLRQMGPGTQRQHFYLDLAENLMDEVYYA